MAWRAFFNQILKELAQVLDQSQLVKFKIFRQRLIDSLKKRAFDKQRRARVYLLREGTAEPADVVGGITDETETQLIGNDLAEGDLVIVGKAVAQAERSKTSFFSKLKP